MSAIMTGTMRFGEWIGERANPLLVKEVRQSLKSRHFIVSFALVLLACWLISVGGVMLSGGQTGMKLAANGKDFFYAYFGVLSFAIFVIVPFQAFRSLINERDQYTFELLSITTMKPGQIVRGKLSSALVQTCLFYSAIAPFVAMTNLLKGVSIPIILFLLLLSMLISSGLSVLALTVGAASKSRGYQTGQTLLTLGLLLFFWASALPSMLFLLSETSVPFDDAEFWGWVAICLSYFVIYFLLTMQLCVSSLTFEADNRSTNVRLCLLGVFWLTFGWSIAGLVLSPFRVAHDFATFLATFLVINLEIAGIFVCFESDRLSRRIRRQLSKSRFRLLLTPLLPGCTRGLIFCYLHLAVSFCVVWILATTQIKYIYGLFLYATISVSLATLINRICQKLVSQYRPLLGQVVTFLAFIMAALAPYIVSAFQSSGFDRIEPSPVMCVTHPFVTLANLSINHADSETLILMLVVMAFASIALNARAMFRVIAETVKLDDGSTEPKPPISGIPDQVSSGESIRQMPEISR